MTVDEALKYVISMGVVVPRARAIPPPVPKTLPSGTPALAVTPSRN